MRILVILMLILSLGCKSKKEATSTKEPIEVKQADAKPTMEENADETSMDKNSAKQVVNKQIDFPDNAIAGIQRTACFGKCPIYKLRVYDNGTAELHAENWLDKEGDFIATVDQERFEKLMQKAEEIGYFGLANVYDSESVTDLPSTITTMRREDELKQVVNRYQGPEKLDKFEKYFDELYLNLDWKKSE